MKTDLEVTVTELRERLKEAQQKIFSTAANN